MAASSVQFRDSESVLEAFRNLEIPSYALVHGSQIIFKYQDGDQEQAEELLAKWLDILKGNDSAAIYTLRIYEEIPGNARITNKTPWHYSFNFRFLDQVMGMVPGSVPIAYGANGLNLVKQFTDLQTQVKELQDRVIELIDEKDEEEEAKPKIGEVLLNQALPHLMPVLARIVDNLIPKKEAAAAVSGNLETDSTRPGFDPREATRILQACDQMKSVAGDVPELMEKLAKFAASKPNDFQTYMNFLKSMY